MSTVKPKPAQPQQSSFPVRVKKFEQQQKSFSILQFNGNLNVDPSNWPKQSIQLAREDNRRQHTGVGTGGGQQAFGEGSEYGQTAREEARRKRLGFRSRTYNYNKQPWLLNIQQKEGESSGEKPVKERRFRSIKQAGATENADYWMFVKVGNEFEAYKIDDWHQFLPTVDKRKVLDDAQVEERFAQRDRVFNQLALKAQIRKQIAGDSEELLLKGAKDSTPQLLIRNKDEDDFSDASEGEEGNDGGESADGGTEGMEKRKVGKKKRKGNVREKKEPTEEEAKMESDDGDEEGREVDYISSEDESSESEFEAQKEVAAKEEEMEDEEDEDEDEIKKERKEKDIDEGESEEDEEEERLEAQENARMSRKMLRKRLSTSGADAGDAVEMMMVDDEQGETDSSSSTEEDPDVGDVKSFLFMQRKPTLSDDDQMDAPMDSIQQGGNGASRKRPAVEDVGQAKGKKQRLERPSSQGAAGSSSASRTAITSLSNSAMEEIVRRLLERKPHDTKELLVRLQEQCGEGSQKLSKRDKKIMITRLVDTIGRIGAYQYREHVGDKEVLYFSMTKSKGGR